MKFGDPRYKWFVAFLLFCVAGLNYGDRTAITAVFPLLRADLGMSDIALGATGTVFLWTYAAVSPFAGYLGDRMSRARLLTMSLGAWSVVMTATAFAGSTSHLLVMRALLGIAEAAYIPAATALIADHHGPATRAKAIGIHIAGFSVGMVGGGALAGYLGDHFGWRPSFVILGVAGLLMTLVCFLFLRDAETAKETTASALPLLEALRRLFRVPSFLVLTAEIVLSGSVNWVFINWLPLFFQETFALSLAMAGLYGTLWIQGGRVAGLMIGGVPSDRAARKHPRFRMLIMVAAYLIASPLLVNFAWSRNFAVIAASITGFALFVGMGYVNAQPLLCELLPEQLRSTAIGFMNMSSCFVGGAGVLLAGALKSSFGMANAFASLAVIQATVAVMLLVTFLTVLTKDLAAGDCASPTVGTRHV
ncbi:MAG: MFS transporter [Bryobacterales bacterium]|nr:MFS transporter [Bryobacterales bacterium]